MKKKSAPKKKENFKTYVRRVIAEVKRHMYLHEWSYSIVWATEDKNVGKDRYTQAEIATDVSYLNFTITVYPQLEKRFDNGKYDEVTEVLVHELSHVYTEPLYQIAYELCAPAANTHVEVIREQQTQRTSQSIYGLLPKELKTVKYGK